MKQLLLFVVFTVSLSYASDFSTGLRFSKENNWLIASSFFTKHLQKYPTDENALYNLGLCHYQLKNYIDAIFYLERAYKYNPNLHECIATIESSRQQLGIIGQWEEPYTGFNLKMMKVSLQRWSCVSIFFSCLSAVLLFLFLRRKKSKKILLPIFTAACFLLISSIYYTVQKSNSIQQTNFGIVVRPVSKTFTDERGTATLNLQLSPGERIKIIEIKERVALQLENQVITWVEKENLRLF